MFAKAISRWQKKIGSLHATVILQAFLSSADFFHKFFKTFFQEHHQSAKQFGPRLGLTFCHSYSGSKLLAKDISS